MPVTSYDEHRDDEAAEKDGELPIFVEDNASDGEESENEENNQSLKLVVFILSVNRFLNADDFEM